MESGDADDFLTLAPSKKKEKGSKKSKKGDGELKKIKKEESD